MSRRALPSALLAGVLALGVLAPGLAARAAAEGAAGAAGAALPAESAPLGDEAAAAAVARLRSGLKEKEAVRRADAIRQHGAGAHARVAAELLRVLAADPDPLVAEAALSMLMLQRRSSPRILPALVRWLDQHAEAESARARRGDPGFPLDPRTGAPALDGPAGRAALELLAARSRAATEALRCVRALAPEPPRSAAAWAPLLGDAHDPLVAEVLDAFAAWRVTSALPEILALYRRYPAPGSWETGAVVHLGGTDASAQRAWMVLFGHPDKQRARPLVVAAIERALPALTGRPFTGPEELATYLTAPEGAAKPGRR